MKHIIARLLQDFESVLARNHYRQQGANPPSAAAPAPTAPPAAATPAAPTAAPAAGGRAPRRTVTSLVDHLSYRIYSWDTERVKAELIRRKLLTDASRRDVGGGPNYSSFHVEDPDGFNLQISGWAGPDDSTNKKKG